WRRGGAADRGGRNWSMVHARWSRFTRLRDLWVRLASSIALVFVACSAPTDTAPSDPVGKASSALTTFMQGEAMTEEFSPGQGEVRSNPSPTHYFFWTDG